MSEQEVQAKKNLMQQFIMALGVLSLVYVMFFLTPEQYQQSLQEEMIATQNLLHNDDAQVVIERARNIYTTVFTNTGFNHYLDQLLDLRIRFNRKKPHGFAEIMVKNLKLMLYQSCFRISLFLYWLHLGAALLIAMVLEGYYTRRIKQYEFGVASANVFRVSTKAAVFSFFILDVYFIFPAAGQYGIMLPPILFLMLSISIKHAVSNFAKVF